MNAGKKIREIRIEKKMKQSELAAEMETTQAYISQVETGKAIPTRQFIKLFCLQYGVSIEDLS